MLSRCEYLHEYGHHKGKFFSRSSLHVIFIFSLQGHKLILAQRSPWFHKLFQSQETGKGERCHVAFFNFTEKMVQNAIDVIYGKEIILTINEKNRLSSLLSKLDVTWSKFEPNEHKELKEPKDLKEPKKQKKLKDPNEPIAMESDITEKEGASKESPHLIRKRNDKKQTIHTQPRTIEESEFKQPTTPPSTSSFNVLVKQKDSSNEDDFFSILDQFTETSEEELQKINHILIGENGQPDRGYKCMKCVEKFKFFTQAQKHHNEHEFIAFQPVREMLKRAELGRQDDDTNLSKIEKAIGKADKKKLIRALRQINENLQKHLETLDGMEKSKLPLMLNQKCKEYTKKLMLTTSRADKVLKKLNR